DGISSIETSVIFASFENSFATLQSTGRIILSPARFSNSLAKSILSSSNNDNPISLPCALKNVYAIPPPIITLSAIFNKFSITPILSETLAPPKIATKGRSGLFTTPPINLISLSIKNPDAVSTLDAMPTLDACSRCAVPNASLINTSPKEDQYLPNSGSFLDSFLPSTSSKRVFSNNNTPPSDKSLIAFSSFSPRVSGTNVTFSFNNSLKRSATGLSDNSFLSSSVFTLPKCENKITLPPCSAIYFIVGSA